MASSPWFCADNLSSPLSHLIREKHNSPVRCIATKNRHNFYALIAILFSVSKLLSTSSLVLKLRASIDIWSNICWYLKCLRQYCPPPHPTFDGEIVAVELKGVRIISTRGAAAKVCNITARPSWAGEWWLASCRMHNTEILTFQTCTSHPHSEYPLKIPNMPSSREYFLQILLANKEDELDYKILRNGVLIPDD